MSSPIAGLDRADCKFLERLNRASEMPSPMMRTRIDKLLDSGLIEENSVGGVTITVRGQLELARWRFRDAPRNRFSVMGYEPSRRLIEKFFSPS